MNPDVFKFLFDGDFRSRVLGDLNLWYLMAGTFVLGVFVIKRDWLNSRLAFKRMLAVSVFLFILGLIVGLSKGPDEFANFALLAPYPSLLLYPVYRDYFKKKFNREPKDTAFDWSPRLFWDRTFNIAYVMSITLLIFLAMLMGYLLR